jgi:hypothetical protein
MSNINPTTTQQSTIATAIPGLFIVVLRSYTLSANEPFAVHCEYADGSEAPIVNAESSMSPSGKYIVRFEVAGRVRLFVNDVLVRDIPELDEDEVAL